MSYKIKYNPNTKSVILTNGNKPKAFYLNKLRKYKLDYNKRNFKIISEANHILIDQVNYISTYYYKHGNR